MRRFTRAASGAVPDRVARAQVKFRKDLFARAQIGSQRAAADDLSLIRSRLDEFASYLGCLAPIRVQRSSESQKDFHLQKAGCRKEDDHSPLRCNPFLTRARLDSITAARQLGV